MEEATKVSGLSLQNRSTDLKAEEEPDVHSSETSGSSDPDPWYSTSSRWWGMVVGDSLLQGTEEPASLTYCLEQFAA